MSRLFTALLISCTVHGLAFWPKAKPVLPPVATTSPVFWMASQPKVSRPQAGRRAASGSRSLPDAEAQSVEWHSLGEMVAEGNAPPSYPLEALDRSWEGTVRVRVQFDDEGKPESVGLAESSGHSILDDAALSSAKSWHTAGGRRRLVEVPVAFKLEDEG